MPNYGYRSNDYMRCSQCNRQTTVTRAGTDHEHCSRIVENSGDRCLYDVLSGMPIAMAYVPWQEFRNLYPAEKGFCRGTIFEDLDKPFLGKGGCLK